MKLKPLIDECLGLMRQLEKEQPQKPDLEELHAVSGVYARLRGYRDKIQECPGPVRSFCEFIQTAQSPAPEIKSFFALLKEQPPALRPEPGESFLKQKQRIAEIADKIGLDARNLFHLSSLARLKGLLGQENELRNDFFSLVNEFFFEE
jgi:hypothetical protein